MAAKRELRREQMREKFIEAARHRIAASGLHSLRARALAADVGSALGGLYNVFADIDDLILRVNSQTLAELKRLIAERLADVTDPRATLRALARAYLDFARRHHKLWSALFEHRLASGDHMPDWYRGEQAMLIESLIAPLRALNPELDRAALVVRARTFFAAVHGIVTISTEQRFIGVPDTDLDQELAHFVDILVAGSRALREIA